MIARLSLAIASITLAAAATAQDNAVEGAAKHAEPASRTGPQIFADRCVYCHDARGWGTRSLARRTTPGQEQLLQRDILPAALVRYAVRRGVGSMPQFTPTEITEEELEILATWLDTLN
jgi:mono/diheme cytochrome c family protein